jgi:hypothetical protein
MISALVVHISDSSFSTALTVLSITVISGRGAEEDSRSRVVRPSPTASHLTPGVVSLLGRVEVRVVRSEACFDLSPGGFSVHGVGPKPTRVEVSPPGCTIGRGRDADLVVTGRDCASVSRCHLLLQPFGRQWIVADLRSSKQTFEVAPDPGGWRRVPANRPLPVEPQMKLRLGHRLQLRFDLIPSEGDAGDTTTRSADGAPVGSGRIRSSNLEELAIALLARRRADPLDWRTPSTPELVASVPFERATVFRLQNELKELPEIAPYSPADRGELCEALAAAFPYLLASVPNGRAG